jgi:hypothetical protein
MNEFEPEVAPTLLASAEFCWLRFPPSVETTLPNSRRTISAALSCLSPSSLALVAKSRTLLAALSAAGYPQFQSTRRGRG